MIHFITHLSVPAQVLLALLVPFVISLCIGNRVVNILRAMKAGQPIREARKGVLAPEHQGKVGTPTMGGVMLIGSLLLTSVLFLDMADPRIQCCVFVTAVTALLGFLDDFAKITKHSTDGVSGWFKIAIQAVAAVGSAFYLYITIPSITAMYVPFYGMLDIGVFFIPLALLVIIGSSNAVNLTDGLDGLASGLMVIASLGFCVVLVCTPDSISASQAPGTAVPVILFLLTIASACAGFLWFNCNPAKMFMGDTGSLALGGALGTVAVCTRTELLLVIVGGMFVAEAVSVMIQVMWFKYTRITRGEGVRFFRMAPIHHHYEKGGLSETQVCVRFWLVGLLLAAAGISLSMLVLDACGISMDVSALHIL